MKQILLFGGSGFLGQSLLEQLASQDVKVYAVTRKLTDDLPQKKTKSIEWIEADLYQPSEWSYLLEDIDVVIDLVGIVREDREKGLTYQHVIFEAAKTIADAMEDSKGKTFIYVSTNLNTDHTPEKYRQTKKETEDYLLNKAFSTVILRPGFMYGASRPEKVALAEKILGNLDQDSPAWAGRPILVDDVAKTIRTIILDEPERQIYELEHMH